MSSVFQIQKKLGWPAVVWFGVLMPTLLWSLTNPVGLGGSAWQFVDAMGRLLGIWGTCLYAINLILSTRWRWTEGLFGGLNRVYIAHHLIGGLAFIALLFHPLFLAIRRLEDSLIYATRLLIPGNKFATDLGFIALGGLIFLLIMTYYIKPPYNIWKFTHKFLGVFFGIAALHIFLAQSTDIESNILLKLYSLILVLGGLFAYLYRVLLPQIFVRTFQYKLVDIESPTHDIIEMTFEPVNQLMNFKVGQFVYVRFTNSPFISRESHPFSIISSPRDGKIVVAAKKLGDYTASLDDLRVGLDVEIEGAFGGFTYSNYQTKHQVWIAGGIGITPFISMAKQVVEKGAYKVDLYYSCKEEGEFAYLDALRQVSSRGDHNFRVVKWIAGDTNFLTADAIEEGTKYFKDAEFFLCGPPPMMRSLKKQLRNKGIRGSRIHTEEFSVL